MLRQYTRRDTVVAMQPTYQYLLTRREYRDLTGESRQSVSNKIKRKTLKTVFVKEIQEVEKIVCPPELFLTVHGKRQDGKVDAVHV